MNALDTLVLMSCGSEKLDRAAPLFDLYTGPMWQTLRKYLGAIPRTNVCVLSARYGFDNAATWCEPYDERISAAKADYLISCGVMRRNDRFGQITKGATGCQPWVASNCGSRDRPYQTVLIGGAGHYRRVFDAFVASFKEHGGVDRSAEVLAVEGGIGEQRSQLGRWLQRS